MQSPVGIVGCVLFRRSASLERQVSDGCTSRDRRRRPRDEERIELFAREVLPNFR
jgi:hypothetical protein